ncbi:MAG TPA: hypothetical protein PKW95_09550 [bacterium]|nr:hypothetical protein [bacterium]
MSRALIALSLLLLMMLAVAACPPDDDDDNDDATPTDDDTIDDDTIDDDTIDDDTTDDDTIDDDTVDDDTVDDDSIDDDTIDDDTTDDDTTDDDTVDDDTTDDDTIDDDTVDDDTVDDDTVDDDTVDDDTIDDDTVDDDTIDDDTVDDDTVDDDTIDDDTVDDDTTDDDTIDDDTIDDDTVDDDTVDDDTVDDDIVMVEGEVEYVDGPPPGNDTVRLAIDHDGVIYVLARQARDLFLYVNADGENWTVEHLAGFADDPDLALDDAGHLHVAYKSLRDNSLVYVTDASGDWQVTTVDASGDVGSHASLALDADGRPRIAYRDDAHGMLKVAVNALDGWAIENVDKSGNVGKDAALLIDAQNKMHVVYRDSAAPSVKYATNESGAWTVETIAATPGDGGQLSAGLLSDGSIVACWYYAYNEAMRIVTNQGGAWTFLNNDEETEYAYGGISNSLVVGPNDSIFIGYSYYFSGYDYESSAMGVKTINHPYVGGAESYTLYYSEPNHSIPTVGNNNDVAIDPAGRLHAVYYYSNPEFGLRHAVYENGDWQLEFAATNNAGATAPSMDLGLNDSAHISYQGGNWGYSNLMYATNQSGAWHPVMQREGDYDYYLHDITLTTYDSNTIAVTPASSTRIAFRYHWYDREGKDADYIEHYINRLQVDSTWNDEEGCGHPTIAVNSEGGYRVAYYRNPGSYPPWEGEDKASAVRLSGGYGSSTIIADDGYRLTAIDFDSEDFVHVAYQTYEGLLRHVTDRSGEWVSETIADLGDAGNRISLVVDGDDHLHVSFGGGDTGGSLYYATNASGEWIVEEVDARDDTGDYSSLAVRADGTILIAYYDGNNNGRLRLASDATGAWTSVAVDRGGSWVTLKLDENDDAHLAYVYGGAVYHTRLDLP